MEAHTMAANVASASSSAIVRSFCSCQRIACLGASLIPMRVWRAPPFPLLWDFIPKTVGHLQFFVGSDRFEAKPPWQPYWQDNVRSVGLRLPLSWLSG